MSKEKEIQQEKMMDQKLEFVQAKCQMLLEIK